MTPENCAVVILAAGASSRFGAAKQLVVIEGRPLINHVVQELRSAGFRSLCVVTGAKHEDIVSVLPEDITVVFNPEWKQGMGKSITCGVNYIAQKFPSCDGVLIVLSDQPGITQQHFQALTQLVAGSVLVGATEYKDAPGAPAAFSRLVFPQLIALRGDRGARQLMRKLGSKVKLVSPNTTNTRLDDIDTPEQYKKFLEVKY